MNYDFAAHVLSLASGPPDAYVLIAASPEYDADAEMVAWFDPLNQRAFGVADVTIDEPDLLEWTDPEGRAFSLRPMTLEVYEREVAPQIRDARTFATVEALRTFFLETVWRAAYGPLPVTP